MFLIIAALFRDDPLSIFQEILLSEFYGSEIDLHLDVLFFFFLFTFSIYGSAMDEINQQF